MTGMSFVFEVCEWIGTAAFAVSGAMTAIDRGSDLFGVLFLSVVTALGGGTIRDILIGHFPPRMFSNSRYLLLACGCALLVFVLARHFRERYLRQEERIEQINNLFDALGLGVFAVSGARIGFEAGFGGHLFLTTFLGMTTAVGGGMLRDMMTREIPFVLTKRIYAVAAIVGALLFSLMMRAGLPQGPSYSAGMAVCVAVRLMATAFHWNLPKALE